MKVVYCHNCLLYNINVNAFILTYFTVFLFNYYGGLFILHFGVLLFLQYGIKK